MTRENYNRFLEVAPAELGKEYFLEWFGTEPNTPFYYIKVRKRGTLFVESEWVGLPIEQGIYIDIFPYDIIPDDEAQAPVDAASMALMREQLADVLKTLTAREARVLSLRYGLEDGNPKTLEEVGKEFNVTRERIRQIEAKALRKLRHPQRSKKLKDFLD